MKIEVKNISYSYNNSSFAIKNASTTINENEFLAIVGHTGSGKSTFIQNLNALLIPTSGSVMVDEVEIKDKIKKATKEKMVYICHVPPADKNKTSILKSSCLNIQLTVAFKFLLQFTDLVTFYPVSR